jgi:hypothetical protein
MATWNVRSLFRPGASRTLKLRLRWMDDVENDLRQVVENQGSR